MAKRHLSQPAFPEKLHVGRPGALAAEHRARLMERINGALDRRWLSNHGPLVHEFEQAVARIAGARHAIATCNATQGLQIAAKACGLTGEVIVPAFTFIATAHALSWIGLTPVFADVNPETHSLDPDGLERLITTRTSAIVAVHLWGIPCQVERLQEIARRHELPIIYDAAHAFGCSDRGRMIGGNGRAEVFSFHATKFVNSGEGGAITTDDDDLAQRLQRMVSFGFTELDRVSDLGTNAKMSEVAAALGLTSIEMMEEIAATNRTNYEIYRRGLAELPGLRLLPYDTRESHNHQYAVVEIKADQAGLSRDQLLESLWSEGVLARRYFYPGCHRSEPYRSQLSGREPRLPVTERLSAEVLVLPAGAAVEPSEVSRVCEIIQRSLEKSEEVWKSLNRDRF
ncbi:MAG TPA: DegT/DnrJ/EryC1/StrS family aminotransferase [Blastocatellia bacterium]|nr:DegT/DnrJ/EryC1/StrS family aminotransferase [Blastocatellia bacterium]